MARSAGPDHRGVSGSLSLWPKPNHSMDQALIFCAGSEQTRTAPSPPSGRCRSHAQQFAPLHPGTNGWVGCCPAVQHPSDARAVVHRPEAFTVHFPDTRSRALTSPTVAQKALPIAAGVVVAAVASALLNRWLAQKAERRNPPLGRFITVDGVRLHYVERGTGTPLVLLHGNGTMIEDFQSSGLIDLAARPGHPTLVPLNRSPPCGCRRARSSPEGLITSWMRSGV